MTSSIFDRVVRVVVQAAHLGPETRLETGTALIGGGLSLDSVAVLEVLIALENEFNVEISADELAQAEALQTAGRLADFIQGKIDAAG